MKLGSLFDGSGGFPLAGCLNGIEPIWASEIEKYPLAVTEARFPKTKQLGDVTRIKGSEIEPVDVITFGSPCQDLSIAGKRAGLEGGRSGLFHEAIRIIDEMRKATNGKYPRFAIWENVPGAFSSNGGADFYEVLQAFCALCDDTISIPQPDTKKGKPAWRKAGLIMGGSFSIAWRVLDAQHWGVPQRRRRIFLVADFVGRCASEVLFDESSLRGNPEPRSTTRESDSTDASGSVAGSGGGCLTPWDAQNVRCHSVNGPWPSLCVKDKCGGVLFSHPSFEAADQSNPSLVVSLQGNGIDRSDTAGCNGAGWKWDVNYTLNTVDRHAVAYGVATNGTGDARLSPERHASLTCGGGQAGQGYPCVCYNRMRGFGDYVQDASSGTLRSSHDKNSADLVVIQKAHKRKHIIRRLVPVECARLQGFPDCWGDIDNKKLQTDSAQYRMWGNGIALPCAVFVLRGIAKVLKEQN